MNRLKAKILDLIRAEGPIGVGHYMHIALTDPEHGYYMKQDPLGRDFITAPEVSQMFGEMIGLFLVQSWEDRGRPARFQLVEFGPGRGTLMADILRAAKIRPAFLNAAQVTLFEASPHLREVQKHTLEGHNVRWAEGMEELGEGPLFLVANEFLDALPAHQFVRGERGWHAGMIAARGDDLVFALSEEYEPPDFGPKDAVAGSILEIGTEAIAAIRTIADRIAQSHGVALIIDYGHRGGLGDTFQAMKGHAFTDPLAEPGDADLTFHVDFAALATAARDAGAYVYGPIPQGTFLTALGIGVRAERLKRSALERAAEIDAALDRLTNPNQMGELFKVMAICGARHPALPGFPC